MSARVITKLLTVAVFVAAVPSSFAQTAGDKKTSAPAMAMPKPAAEMATLKFFDGSWTCSGEGAMEPGGPMMKMTSTVMSKTDLGGFWQTGTVKGASMAGMPPFEGMFHMTWDAAKKEYVMFWVDNMGGWSESRTSGWAGDNLVFTGEGQMGADKMGMRDTFMRKGDGTMGHVGEMQANGKWMKMMDETCRKGRP